MSAQESPTTDKDILWVYVALIAAASIITWLISLSLLPAAFSGLISLLIAAITILCGLRFGPAPLLFAALTYLAITEPPQMLSRQPILSIMIAAGIGTAILCIARARSICIHHQLRFYHLRVLFSRTTPLPTGELVSTFASILTAIMIGMGIVLFVLWLVPQSSDALRVAGLRPTALRALQIMFLFASAYVVARLFIIQMAFRRMRPAQARVYLGSLLSGWLLPDVRGMYKTPRRKRNARKTRTQ